MDVDEILEYVNENNPEATVFINPDFRNAIIGYTDNSEGLPVVAYNYRMMCELLAAEYAEEEIEDPYISAIEWIDYNTLRTLPYMGNGRPIIIYC